MNHMLPFLCMVIAAALQAARAGPNLVLIGIDTKTGHGDGKPIGKIIDEVSDQLSFLTKALHMDQVQAAEEQIKC